MEDACYRKDTLERVLTEELGIPRPPEDTLEACLVHAHEDEMEIKSNKEREIYSKLQNTDHCTPQVTGMEKSPAWKFKL